MITYKFFRYFLVAFVALCGGMGHSVAVQAATPAGVWADSVIRTLTPRQRIGQLFVPRLDITDNAAGYAKLHTMVVDEGIGGILLGKGTAKSYVNVINRAQSEAKVPLMVTLDGEWGPAMRVTDAPKFPYNMTLGAIRDPNLMYDYGLEVARECRLLGIQVDFAPVLDVNSNPDNPVIGYRSFGEDPGRVAQHGAMYCRGLETGGVMAVGKHFPGHGDTSVDSHKALAKVTHDRVTLEAVDLLPFKECMKHGMSGIMVGHLDVPSMDRSGKPASLSKVITTDILKGELGYDGLVFTDALAMKGALSKSANNCVLAFKAGADIMLSSANPVADIAAMASAVKRGEISQQEIDARCRRVLEAKYRLGLSRKPVPGNPQTVASQLNSPQAKALIDRLARAAVTVLRNGKGELPIGNLGRIRIAVVNIGAPAHNDFSDYCGRYADVKSYGITQGTLSRAVINDISEADVVITGLYSNKAWAVEAFRKLKPLAGVIPVFFMNPYKMSAYGDLSEASTVVAAYGDMPSLQKAAAQALFGGIGVSGRFPVNVPGVGRVGEGVDIPKCRIGFASPAEEGMNSDLSVKIDSIVDMCIRNRAFPGCQVAVVRNGNFVIDKAYGHLTYDPNSPKVTDGTLYDIASMTKPLSTVAALMRLYDDGVIGIDDKVSDYVPELADTDKADLSLSDLLYHQSGLTAIDVSKLMLDPDTYSGALTLRNPKARNARLRSDLIAQSRSETYSMPVAKGLFASESVLDTLMAKIYSAPLKSPVYRYSCLNFCLLDNVIENATGVPLDQIVETEVYAPIGAWHTGYLPLQRFPLSRIAPTERDNLVRHQLLQGYVHDELAAFSGGVQGNAGVFSNAEDVAKICQTLLNGGEYGTDRIFGESTVRLFTAVPSESRRTLGFDMAGRFNSLKEAGAPDSAYGHTGFTGTCFWIDPEADLIYVFLCNKVYPDRDNKAFGRLLPRVAIMAEIYRALTS